MSNNEVGAIAPESQSLQPQLAVEECWDIHGVYHSLDYLWVPTIAKAEGIDLVQWSRSKGSETHYLPDQFTQQEIQAKNSRRNQLEKSVGLMQGDFFGSTGYELAITNVKSLDFHLPLPDEDELKVAARTLVEQIRLRRLNDFVAQVDHLNEIVDNEKPWVRLIKPSKDETQNLAAKLKGFFIATDGEDGFVPGLLLEGKSGQIGTIPTGWRPFGLFLELA